MIGLELAGLPGSGKTTICREFANQHADARYARVSRHRRRVRRSVLFNLFSPIAAWRFYRVLELAARSEGRFPPRAVSASALEVLWRRRKQSAESADALIRLHSFLTLFLMEHSLARIEAMLKRTFSLHDEGYVQRLIGVWLRFPREHRAAAWDAFVAAIPSGVHCAFVDVPAAQALERALERRAGVSRIFTEACDGPAEKASLLRLYEEVHDLVRELESSRGVVLHRIDARATPAEMAAELAALVREQSRGRPVTLYLRER